MNRIYRYFFLSLLILAFSIPVFTQPCKPSGIRYNQVQQLSSHNSYDKNKIKPDIEIQADSGIRSFEFDIHAKHAGIFHKSYPAGEWGVFHITDILSGGDYGSSLTECLKKVKAWHDRHPGHEVITIWLQLVGDWNKKGHNPLDLDSNIRRCLTRDMIYTPYRFLLAGGAGSLQQAAASGWPLLDSLKGKFVIVLTGNNPACSVYLKSAQTACFVAPQNIDSTEVLSGDWSNAVFFNFSTSQAGVARFVSSHGLVARMYAKPRLKTAGSIESPADYELALKYQIQHIATDHVSQKMFSPRLTDVCGKPFRMMK
jgi:hypothetical protein